MAWPRNRTARMSADTLRCGGRPDGKGSELDVFPSQGCYSSTSSTNALNWDLHSSTSRHSHCTDPCSLLGLASPWKLAGSIHQLLFVLGALSGQQRCHMRLGSVAKLQCGQYLPVDIVFGTRRGPGASFSAGRDEARQEKWITFRPNSYFPSDFQCFVAPNASTHNLEIPYDAVPTTSHSTRSGQLRRSECLPTPAKLLDCEQSLSCPRGLEVPYCQQIRPGDVVHTEMMHNETTLHVRGHAAQVFSASGQGSRCRHKEEPQMCSCASSIIN